MPSIWRRWLRRLWPPRRDEGPPLARSLRAGPYELIERVARGASGEVWRARETGSGRTVALKWAIRDASVPNAATRFENEATLRRRLDHPHIQRLLAAGTERGRPWMALEWVEGVDLQAHVGRGRMLPVAEVVTIGIRAAEALAYAHDRGVLHRDLKPANVLFDREHDVVKLTDFGVARHEDDPQRTRSGAWLGTPAYMAPELLAGAPADARTDQYALAAMLFELLAGRPPHVGANLGELMQQVATQPAPVLDALRPGLPVGLSELLARGLAHRPDDRFEHVRDFAQALRAVASTPGMADAEPRHNPGT